MDICIECKWYWGPGKPAPAHEQQCTKFHDECRVIRLEYNPDIEKCMGFEKITIS